MRICCCAVPASERVTPNGVCGIICCSRLHTATAAGLLTMTSLTYLDSLLWGSIRCVWTTVNSHQSRDAWKSISLSSGYKMDGVAGRVSNCRQWTVYNNRPSVRSYSFVQERFNSAEAFSPPSSNNNVVIRRLGIRLTIYCVFFHSRSPTI